MLAEVPSELVRQRLTNFLLGVVLILLGALWRKVVEALAQRMAAGGFRLGKHCFPNLDIKDLDDSDVGEHWITESFLRRKGGGGFCPAIWPCGTRRPPRAPQQPSFAWPARHDTRRIRPLAVVPNNQLGPPSATTNS